MFCMCFKANLFYYRTSTTLSSNMELLLQLTRNKSGTCVMSPSKLTCPARMCMLTHVWHKVTVRMMWWGATDATEKLITLLIHRVISMQHGHFSAVTNSVQQIFLMCTWISQHQWNYDEGHVVNRERTVDRKKFDSEIPNLKEERKEIISLKDCESFG